MNDRIRKSMNQRDSQGEAIPPLPRIGQFGGVFSWWPRDPRVDP